ncbi:feline leukemia virus subgroup C receptor-related protein 2-like isoform X2 [Athalia rosae]|uniref:feline leukemia virus subgroup C receptor-related protein 2-like isoform X2 n=1 Tax=Athalia rosae TaxID=37344 RepID=UPI0020342A2B|nr:feline leukemia virus subgroup C receptor-related protein 2-like isoform X2 [Athalia rosae]
MSHTVGRDLPHLPSHKFREVDLRRGCSNCYPRNHRIEIERASNVQVDDESSRPLKEKEVSADIPSIKVLITKSQTTDKEQFSIRTYKRRWLAVAIFILYAAPSTAQWIQYSIISNITARYYHVSVVAVDWTAITFMFFYIPFILPATWLMDHVGLRWTAILGSGLSCLGSWIKVFSAAEDRYWVTFIGQSVVATTQVFILSAPGRLAACWFGPKEVATATALCLFGTQMGVAAGFLISPILIGNHQDLDLVGRDFQFVFKYIAAITTFAMFIVISFFKNEPKSPPSKSRALQKSQSNDNREPFLTPVKRLLTNRIYLTLCNSYGFGVGVLNAVATLLNQMILQHFKDGEQIAGQVGLLLTLMGMMGAVVSGFVIGKTHKFKETAVIIYFLTFVGQVLFAMAMMQEILWMVYVSSMFLGFFLGNYLTLGYELCVEYTYPEAEIVATGILNVLNNLYGIFFVLGLGKVIDTYGDFAAHVGLCSALFVGFVITVFTKDEQRRQTVLRENKNTEALGL